VGDPIPPEICKQSDTPFQTPQPISTPSASTVRAGEKVQLALTGSRPCVFQQAIVKTVYVTPKSPKGWLKVGIFTFGVAFHIFIAGNRRHFKYSMWVEHSKSQPTDDKPSLKWV